MKTKLPFVVRSGHLAMTFSEASGGLPEQVVVREADGHETRLFSPGSMRLEIELADGRCLRPAALPEHVRVFTLDGARHVEFSGN
jgi:hypothetical protein